MGLIVDRDLDALRSGIERWLDRPIRSLHRPAVGFSCETLVVDEELVLRLPPVQEGIFPSYDLALQAAVQNAARAAGVPVAAPARIETDTTFLGTEFLAMPFVAGSIPSGFTPADPWLGALGSDNERRSVWEGFLDALVALHRTSTTGLGLRRGLAAELDGWDDYVAWATDGSPPETLSEVLGWCRGNRPPDGPPDGPPSGLLWGDVRLGNVVFDPATLRPAAILDWDMVSAGPFEQDLAWFVALEDLQIELTSASVPGFGTRIETLRWAETRLGRQLRHFDWFEVFALARAAAISTRIAILHERAGRRSLFKVGEDPALAAALQRIG